MTTIRSWYLLDRYIGSVLTNPDYHAPIPDESSTYPEPSDFEVMRPTYHEDGDGFVTSTITVSPPAW